MPYSTTIHQVTVFETDDGVQHKTQAEAETHNEVRALAENLGNGLDWREISPRDVAVWLIENYPTIFGIPSTNTDDVRAKLVEGMGQEFSMYDGEHMADWLLGRYNVTPRS